MDLPLMCFTAQKRLHLNLCLVAEFTKWIQPDTNFEIRSDLVEFDKSVENLIKFSSQIHIPSFRILDFCEFFNPGLHYLIINRPGNCWIY
jgi:hypothetical protein